VFAVISVDVKTTEPDTVAYIVMRGPYAQMSEAMGRLYGWVAQHGLQPAGMPSGVYMTDPATVGQEHAAWEVRAPIAGDPPDAAPDSSDCGIKHVESRLVTYTMYRGPCDQIAPTYDEMSAWIGANGYSIAGPPEEIYISDPATTPASEYLTEIRFPVEKA
jgi:effector-binding domain-containing protein